MIDTKYFKVYYDKPQTLKERLTFHNKNKIEKRVILDDVNLKIKKGKLLLLLVSMVAVRVLC